MEGFEGIVNNITTNNYLTFTEEEIPIEGRGHNRALHMSVKCMDHIVAKVLVETGSSLNVIPKSMLRKLPFNASHLRPSSMIVQAFDVTRRNVIGEIDLPIQIGPQACQVTFQVMDINPAYGRLLGRPWIHSVVVIAHPPLNMFPCHVMHPDASDRSLLCAHRGKPCPPLAGLQ